MSASRSEEEETRQINEEYKIWKKNTPFLYDTVMTHALEWPSLTVQWLPSKEIHVEKGYSVHQIILGTHTSDQEQNYLMRADVVLPIDDVTAIDPSRYNDETHELGGFGASCAKVEVKQKMSHDSEVNRARVMPQNEFVVATKTTLGHVNVYEWTRHANRPSERDAAVVKPQLRLRGHTKEGYGLSWNPRREALLASGADDGLLCVWDLLGNPAIAGGGAQPSHAQGVVEMDPLRSINAHPGGSVGDVAFANHTDLVCTVGDDRKLNLWDLRVGGDKAQSTVIAHDSEINAVAFSPLHDSLLATGGADKAVKIWDLRRLSDSIHVLAQHSNEVFAVQWNHKVQGVLATGGADRRVMVWDLSRIGSEMLPDELEDGPPELLFIHGGHTAKISDIAWNPNDEWFIASVSEDNILQVWQMAENIFVDDEGEDVPAGQLE